MRPPQGLPQGLSQGSRRAGGGDNSGRFVREFTHNVRRIRSMPPPCDSSFPRTLELTTSDSRTFLRMPPQSKWAACGAEVDGDMV